jgi:hypothetical protein
MSDNSLDKLGQFIADAQYRKIPVLGPKDLPKEFLEHSSVYYIRALLEDHFSPRKFNLLEIKGLIREVFPKHKLNKERSYL